MKTNNYYRYLLLLLLLSFTGAKTYAYDIAVANADGVTIYYNYINDGTELEVTYNNYSGAVNIPSVVTYENKTMNVTSIGNSAFYGCYGLTSVTIGNSVTSIGSQAFYNCSGLTSVTIGNSVTNIGGNAFYYCSGLQKVIVNDIAAWCGITFSDSNSNPLSYAHHLYSDENTEITNLVIPNSVTSIGNFAFYGCYGLTSVTIGNSVTSIGNSAFSGCSGLTSVTIGNSVTSIGSGAFYNCSGLTSVTIPNSVTSIGSGAFYNCSGLTSVTIGNSVTSIGDNSFYYCSGLTSVTIPNSVTSIGSGAFYNCSGLTSVTIGNSVTNIGGNAFYYCSGLTSITIPNSVTSIGYQAFYSCYRLNTINCLNPIPPTCSDKIFYCYKSSDNIRDQYDVYTYANLHVPMGSKELYSSAYEWRYFNKIKEDMQANGVVYYAYLTVKQGTTGYTRQAVKADEQYTLYIGSLGENRVNSVSFNGVDVTDELVNGYYTTPEITTESVLSVTYETNVTGISSTTINSDVKVIGYNGEISISQIDEPSDVQVYTVDGKLVDTRSSAFGSVTIQVQDEQLYLVKVGNRTYKVAL